MTGLLLVLFGLAVLGAEAWLPTTGALVTIPLMTLTVATLAVVAREIWAGWA